MPEVFPEVSHNILKTMKKALIFILLAVAAVYFAWQIARVDNHKGFTEAVPVWIENDSAQAIESRIRSDFRLTRAEALAKIQEKHPEVTEADLDRFIANHYVEAKTIDGQQYIHRKSPGNLELLNPDYNGGARYRGDHASEARISYVDSVLNYYKGTNPKGLAHKVTYSFSVDVPFDSALVGDTLRVWIPLPLDNPEGGRQSDVKILDAEPSNYVTSTGKSVHNTVYFEGPAAAAPGDTVHFEYVGSFVTRGAWMPATEIESRMKPYDKTKDTYRRYTSFEAPHIIRLDSLARTIVGDETNPFKQSEMVYDYIIRTYPWAGAREYSTIECMPEYVVTEGHGDCGQVSLLYISLMRSLGVPARWESGWMLHPHEKNLHDWAEVYFEGIGWLPVDVSFGRYTTSKNPDVVGFYSHGIDGHRFATNQGVCGELYPAKKYVRSETVDFQLGEVECSKGNMFYPGWDSTLRLIEIEPVEE